MHGNTENQHSNVVLTHAQPGATAMTLAVTSPMLVVDMDLAVEAAGTAVADRRCGG